MNRAAMFGGGPPSRERLGYRKNEQLPPLPIDYLAAVRMQDLPGEI
jgi:hypothetical protein